MSTWPSLMVGTAEDDLPKLFSLNIGDLSLIFIQRHRLNYFNHAHAHARKRARARKVANTCTAHARATTRTCMHAHAYAQSRTHAQARTSRRTRACARVRLLIAYIHLWMNISDKSPLFRENNFGN